MDYRFNPVGGDSDALLSKSNSREFIEKEETALFRLERAVATAEKLSPSVRQTTAHLAPGRVEFLQKPFTREVFLAVIAKLLPV